MDNTIAKLLDLFKHISRDIMIYAISGFVVIVNFFIIDKFYLGGIYFGLIDKLEYISLIIFILSYVIGHVIMSLMQIVDFIEPCIYKLFKLKNINFKDEVKIFKKNQNTYDYFIERQNQLTYFRWTLSGAFFILTLINSWYKYIEKVDISLYFIFIPLLIAIFLLILHYRTEKEYIRKIKLLIDS
ncbi:hypothetical protein [Aliarcobacter thereius]|uniref:Uncharacterized protein n=1 Tax=Aliarcobacter thereius LMG 24486 TaxID=1032240 RepID=A0A1C7WPT2_9BACT|nr:hypothetical protein [Aliarcobacter thereius]OCL92455.1 hypothetical protein AAX27_01233 [Aliarcobacter thereius]OCL95766.1 hypothetical protein AA347_01246 [Aliarcobacter thereius LMG 24486]QBF16259.1 putative membrane protein [Aliarcobacter thereius LMG 24486]TLS92117.1 hypothetical protein FE244_06860 [Aliarcobacter thereius]